MNWCSSSSPGTGGPLTVLIPLFYLPRIRKALENKSNMEDDRVAILEAQLAQAKLIAEEADKKYEEVRERLSSGRH